MNLTAKRILITLSLIIGLLFMARYTNVIPSLRNIFKPAPVVVDETPLLVTHIKNIAQLMTLEAYNEVVVDSTRYPFGIPPRIFNAIPGNPLGLIGASQLVLIVRGKVVAGVDLGKLDTSHIRHRSDSLFIQLPPAQVLEVIINPSDVEMFIEKGEWNEAAATALKIQARTKLVQQALAQGALQQADTRARELVYGLFKNMNYKSVIITTGIQMTTPSGKQ